MIASTKQLQLSRMAEIEAYANTGSEEWFRYSPLCRDLIVSENFKRFAEAAECFWLIDIVASALRCKPSACRLRAEPLVVWRFERLADDSCVVTAARDSKESPIFRQVIEFSDFPRDSFRFYVIEECGNFKLMLRQEY